MFKVAIQGSGHIGLEPCPLCEAAVLTVYIPRSAREQAIMRPGKTPMQRHLEWHKNMDTWGENLKAEVRILKGTLHMIERAWARWRANHR